MSIEQTFAEYFKPEIQKRGREDFAKGLAFVTNAGDTQIQGLFKAMPAVKVNFRADAISDPVFYASCSCSSAGRGSFCKHMWAMILATQKKHPDFLESKTQIEFDEGATQAQKAKPKLSVEAEARAEAYKAKQDEYKKSQKEKQSLHRKIQYQKQKLRLNHIKADKKKKESEPPPPRERYTDAIEDALEFFSKNGFNMDDVPDLETLKLARKHLSRVFHPDKGGTHDEAVLLNKNFEVLNKFILMTTKVK